MLLLAGKYQTHCLSCHGVDGSGDSVKELAGANHSLIDSPQDKTIGTYWPILQPCLILSAERCAVTAYRNIS
ncbi:MAG: c-type cytochrome [Methylococcaceae bacterium]